MQPTFHRFESGVFLPPLDEPIPTPGMRLPAILFCLTAATTFAAGVAGWQPLLFSFDDQLAQQFSEHWPRGLAYAIAVMAVLAAHEFGHFIAARLYRIPATLPFFIPVPVLLTGTLGAVIGMDGSRANRRQIFDIALAGPLAGLVVAVPLLAIGMLTGTPAERNPFALPLLARWMLSIVRPDLASGFTIDPNPLFMAGWVGLLVTGLNMIPISQLDGGHISYALLGDRARWLARSILAMALFGIVVLGRFHWIVMVVVVVLMGISHPPIREDGQSLGRLRITLGVLSFLIPLVTFMPEPLVLE